jgi:cephalosporin hydroxylase
VTLAECYEELCRTPSDIYLHLPRFVALVDELKAQHVIELGTRSGVSTVAWLYALEATGGRLTSIDLDPPPDLGVQHDWLFVQGDDCDPNIVACLELADIVFIDSSHHYRHTLTELYTYRWLVNPGGVIVCHDTMLERPEGAPLRPRFPVRTAIEEFVKSEGYEWINIPECFGLGIVKVV